MRISAPLTQALLVSCFFWIKASARDEEGLFSNFLFEEAVDEAQCEQMQREVSALDSETSVDKVPHLHGKWVSQECEVRPGPEFLLRSYTFFQNNSFRLLQHFFSDESCLLPLYSVVARGNLTAKQASWVTPSAMEYEYSLAKVVVLPFTTEAAEKMSEERKQKCSASFRKPWKPHREYTAYSAEESPRAYKYRQRVGRSRRRQNHKHVDCLSALGITFSELSLMRTQWRPVAVGKKNRELLLGDIHSRRDFSYKPSAFQTPLLHVDHAHDCANCHLVDKGTERSVPELNSKPQLPPVPQGQWISQRCEVRSMGLFLTRRFSFDPRDDTWMSEYKFYADPFCSELAFAISSSGKYEIESIHKSEKYLKKRKTGYKLDLLTEEASLTLYDPTLRDSFNAETNCGVGKWYLGIAKDLLPTSGCSILGIDLPSIDFDLIKLDIDARGTPLLYLGLQDTDGKRRSHQERPTSYQAPLAQCSVFSQQNAFNTHLPPISYADIRTSGSGRIRSSAACLIISLCLVIGRL